MTTKDMGTAKDSESLLKTSVGEVMSFDELDSFFDDFLSCRLPRLLDWNMPNSSEFGLQNIDIHDYDADIEAQSALPGVKKEELNMLVSNQAITIRTSAKKEKQEEAKGEYFRREIIRGKFQRTLSIPDNVDGEKANALFKDDILKVTIPKAERSRRKAIEVHQSASLPVSYFISFVV